MYSVDNSYDFHNHKRHPQKEGFRLMAHKPRKKGPHKVTTASKPTNDMELERQELEAEVKSFITRVHGSIQSARTKMSDEQIEKADKEAEAILKAASDTAKASRHSA